MKITKNHLELFSLIKERMFKAEYDWEELKEINYLGYIVILEFKTNSGEWKTRGEIEITVYNHNKLISIDNEIEHTNKVSSYWTDLKCDEYYVKVYDCVVKMINYLDENYNNELAGRIKNCKHRIADYTKELNLLEKEWKLKNE